MGMKISIEHLFSLKKDRTRGHEVTLLKNQYRLDIRKYSFSQRRINEWNRLYTDIRIAHKGGSHKDENLLDSR